MHFSITDFLEDHEVTENKQPPKEAVANYILYPV